MVCLSSQCDVTASAHRGRCRAAQVHSLRGKPLQISDGYFSALSAFQSENFSAAINWFVNIKMCICSWTFKGFSSTLLTLSLSVRVSVELTFVYLCCCGKQTQTEAAVWSRILKFAAYVHCFWRRRNKFITPGWTFSGVWTRCSGSLFQTFFQTWVKHNNMTHNTPGAK